MKLLIVGDVHWSTYSSIVRKRGEHYSIRLENLIKSLNWAENVAEQNNCDNVLYLGDFFDKPELNAEELTALNDIKWSKLPHYFIVGNHESNVVDLKFNSTEVLFKNKFEVIKSPKTFNLDDCSISILPYIVEDERKKLNEYFNVDKSKKHYIFSHNDIKGIRYGAFESKTGFEIEDIKSNCDLYINGHLHNGSFVDEDKRILNLGILSGQNFSEDASKYKHQIAILDTETGSLTFFENPYSLNFYKISIEHKKDLSKLDKVTNGVIALKCEESLLDDLKTALKMNSNIIEYKLILFKDDNVVNEVQEVKLNNVDHLKQFNDFVLNNIGSFDVVKEELSIICGNNN